MPSSRYDAHSKVSPVEEQRLNAALRAWMDILETEPILLLGYHKPTGGLIVIPIFDKDATTAEVLEILEETIAYIRKSQSS